MTNEALPLPVQKARQEFVERIFNSENLDTERTTKLLFSGGRCVIRSILSVAASRERLDMSIQELHDLLNHYPRFPDTNEVMDFIFDMEGDVPRENRLGGFVLDKYRNTKEAPDLEELAEVIKRPNTQVCISLNTKEQREDGQMHSGLHMAHVTGLLIEAGNIKAVVSSDSDDGKKIESALNNNEPYDVFVFKPFDV